MRIERAIKIIHALPSPDGWVRLEQVRKAQGRLQLCFSIHRENRGRKKTGDWSVTCLGVREAHITNFDGGGVRIYPSTHPAVRQYVAGRAVLQWPTSPDKLADLGALYEAHRDAVGDWIPFDRYVPVNAIAGNRCVCRGPDFLMRVYAKALRAQGENPRLIPRRSNNQKLAKLKVLHFGESFVVAAQFTAERALL